MDGHVTNSAAPEVPETPPLKRSVGGVVWPRGGGGGPSEAILMKILKKIGPYIKNWLPVEVLRQMEP